MVVRFGACRVELVQGDIARQEVEAIVTAANAALAGGGGVDGAVHRAAGPGLLEEAQRLYPTGCPTGSAVATGAGLLKARHVFHAVGPVWRGGQQKEPDLLRSAYRTCLELAGAHDCRSVAFPSIATGVYGYPVDLAAAAALDEVRDFLVRHGRPELVRFVLFDGGTFGTYARVLETMTE